MLFRVAYWQTEKTKIEMKNAFLNDEFKHFYVCIVEPTCTPTVGCQAFSVAAACILNSFPQRVIFASQLPLFQTRLKTYRLMYPFH